MNTDRLITKKAFCLPTKAKNYRDANFDFVRKLMITKIHFIGKCTKNIKRISSDVCIHLKSIVMNLD